MKPEMRQLLRNTLERMDNMLFAHKNSKFLKQGRQLRTLYCALKGSLIGSFGSLERMLSKRINPGKAGRNRE
jgi:hypothetical protein